MIVKLLTEQHLEFLCLTGGCRGPSESTLVKMPHCWKSHVTAQLCLFISTQSLDFKTRNSFCQGNTHQPIETNEI